MRSRLGFAILAAALGAGCGTDQSDQSTLEDCRARRTFISQGAFGCTIVKGDGAPGNPRVTGSFPVTVHAGDSSTPPITRVQSEPDGFFEVELPMDSFTVCAGTCIPFEIRKGTLVRFELDARGGR